MPDPYSRSEAVSLAAAKDVEERSCSSERVLLKFSVRKQYTCLSERKIELSIAFQKLKFK